MNYKEKLTSIQDDLPFDYWPNVNEETDDDDGDGLFFEMIDQLIAIGQNGEAAAKADIIQRAVIALNVMAEANPGLIEIEEQEDICEMLNGIAAAAGLDMSAYKDGKSIADQWRTW